MTWEDILWDPGFDFVSYLAEHRERRYSIYLKSVAWKRRRNTALQLAGDRCEICKSHNRLQVHHLSYDRLGDELPTDLLVVCDPCHGEIHRIGWTAERFEDPVAEGLSE